VARGLAPQGLFITALHESLQNKLTNAFLAASETDAIFKALPQKQQTFSLVNGHQILISQPEDGAVLEVLGPNGLVNSRLATLNQIADALEAQGISTQEIDEIKEVAQKGHEIAQFRRCFADVWTLSDKPYQDWKVKEGNTESAVCQSFTEQNSSAALPTASNVLLKTVVEKFDFNT
jgi:hypothetical protein